MGFDASTGHSLALTKAVEDPSSLLQRGMKRAFIGLQIGWAWGARTASQAQPICNDANFFAETLPVDTFKSRTHFFVERKETVQ